MIERIKTECKHMFKDNKRNYSDRNMFIQRDHKRGDTAYFNCLDCINGDWYLIKLIQTQLSDNFIIKTYKEV